MPSHKRLLFDDDEDPVLSHRAKLSRRQPQFDHEEPDEEDREEEEKGDGEDSEDGASSGADEKPEFITVELPEIRKDVQCPICLGIIKKTRTVMECLHRFCRECIDKSMRLGNKECPACRTHCASRRSLRDDPNYDALIAALYPDIDKYDEEEVAFHEEDRTRNRQIQEEIAQISQRQTEALVKRRTLGKDKASAFTTRSQRLNAPSRRKRNHQVIEKGSEDNEDEKDNNEGKYSSSTDEQQRYRRHVGAPSSQPSPSAANSDLVWNAEMLAWGRGGARSNTRQNGSSNKSARTSRLPKLAEYLRSFEEEDTDESDVHVMLVSLDTKRTPSLQQPYLRCRSCLTVRHLCEYISCKTPLRAEDVEVLVVKGNDNLFCDKSLLNPSTLENDLDPASLIMNQCKDKLQILEGRETLAGLKANCISSSHHLIIAYRQKDNT